MKFNAKFFPKECPNAVAGKDGQLIISFKDPVDPGDQSLGSRYVYDPALVLAINVALATHRPLLLVGEPGSGKTSAARNIALTLKWAYYQYTVTSRSQAGELLWDVDTLRRLNDAYGQNRNLLGEEHYVQPGPLWWAIAPATAKRRGVPVEPVPQTQTSTPELPDPPGHQATGGAVLLIDEIDKAEPDVPNDLLEVLDTRRFVVKGRPIKEERKELLIVITSNGERELPAAFLRRCVVFRMPEPGEGWFADIAVQRGAARSLADAVEVQLRAARKKAKDRELRPPGTAEYLDAVTALAALEITARDDEAVKKAWELVEQILFTKQDEIEGH